MAILALLVALALAGACDSNDAGRGTTASSAATSSIQANADPTNASVTIPTTQPAAVVLRPDGFGSVAIDMPAAQAIAAATACVEVGTDAVLHGYLSGSGAADKVEGIAVGDNCVFR